MLHIVAVPRDLMLPGFDPTACCRTPRRAGLAEVRNARSRFEQLSCTRERRTSLELHTEERAQHVRARQAMIPPLRLYIQHGEDSVDTDNDVCIVSPFKGNEFVSDYPGPRSTDGPTPLDARMPREYELRRHSHMYAERV